jgi:Fe-S cluster biosynthesis and repair protein YggX
MDEVVYIARASEGALTADWIMKQPIFIRKKYLDQFLEERKKLEQKMNK